MAFVLQLFGTPVKARFEFMWEIMARGKAAYVIMVDSTCPGTLERTNYLLDRFATFPRVPYGIAANKQDGHEHQ